MKTYKNYLPEDFFNKLNTIVSSNEFQWYFSNRTIYKIVDEGSDNFMFTHKLSDYRKDNPVNSDWFNIFYPFIYFLNKEHKVNNLMRMQLNMYTNQNKKIQHPAHTDYEEKEGENVKTGVFNFTTCNGGTTIGKKFYKSKANEFHVCDNNVLHCGTAQTDTQTRIIININWR